VLPAGVLDAQLQGADLQGAQLQGADLQGAQLQGANLQDARLQGADLRRTALESVSLHRADMQGVLLFGSGLQDANLRGAGLQGAVVGGDQLKGASLAGAAVWRMRGDLTIDLTDLDNCDRESKPWMVVEAIWADLGVLPAEPDSAAFAHWRDEILNAIPSGARREATSNLLSKLDPAEKAPKDMIDAEFWTRECSIRRQNPNFATSLADLACSANSAPFIARGLLHNGLIEATGTQVVTISDRLRKGRVDPAACPGVHGFTDVDWTTLDQLVAEAVNPKVAK
jgi:hypothetical protein